MVHTTFYYGLQVKKNKKLFSFYNHMEFLLEIPPSRVCQNRHILLFVFLQARRGKIPSTLLF